MARGKIGGTKAKLTGQVGTEIYQTTRSGEGKLIQKVYAKPSYTYSNSDNQALARMIMGQIERMFHFLPSIITDSYAHVSRGSLSFQYFSKINYPLLKNDIENNWDGHPDFDWQVKYVMNPPAGIWKLTEGTLLSLKYDSEVFYDTRNNGVYLNVDNITASLTIDDLLTYMNLKRGDLLYFVMFIKDYPNSNPRVVVKKFIVNKDIPLTSKVINSFEDDILIPEDESTSGSYYDITLKQFTIWYEDANPEIDYLCSCFTPFIVRHEDNGTHFSSAQFKWGSSYLGPSYYRANPNDVYTSWKEL